MFLNLLPACYAVPYLSCFYLPLPPANYHLQSSQGIHHSMTLRQRQHNELRVASGLCWGMRTQQPQSLHSSQEQLVHPQGFMLMVGIW